MKVQNLFCVILMFVFFLLTIVKCGDGIEALTESPEETSGEISESEAKSFVEEDADAIAEQTLESI